MKRYCRIYWLLIKINCARLFAYRPNLINSAIATIGWGLVSIFSMVLLTTKTSSIYGWNKNELMLIGGIFTIILGITHTLFSRNFDKFSLTINKGYLDGILLRPLDSQFQISCWYMNFTSALRIPIGFIFTLIILQQVHISISLITYIMFLVFLILGVSVIYSTWFLVATIIIWYPNLSNLVGFLYNFNNLGRYPKDIITHTGNIFLFVLIPLTLVASVPVKLLAHTSNWKDCVLLLTIACVLFYVSRKFWQFALRFYTSASG